MSLSFRSAGIKDTTSFSADADPNVGAPLAPRILEVPDRTDTGRIATGLRAKTVFVNPSGGPVIDLTVWLLDERSGTWAEMKAFAGLGDNKFFEVPGTGSARIFFQITGLTGGSTDSVEILVAPE